MLSGFRESDKVQMKWLLFQVESVGQPIGCIVADDVAIARRAAKLVRVEYERLSAILTIEVYTMETFKKIRLIVVGISPFPRKSVQRR